jgi:hypothetical protein
MHCDVAPNVLKLDLEKQWFMAACFCVFGATESHFPATFSLSSSFCICSLSDCLLLMFLIDYRVSFYQEDKTENRNHPSTFFLKVDMNSTYQCLCSSTLISAWSLAESFTWFLNSTHEQLMCFCCIYGEGLDHTYMLSSGWSHHERGREFNVQKTNRVCFSCEQQTLKKKRRACGKDRCIVGSSNCSIYIDVPVVPFFYECHMPV